MSDQTGNNVIDGDQLAKSLADMGLEPLNAAARSDPLGQKLLLQNPIINLDEEADPKFKEEAKRAFAEMAEVARKAEAGEGGVQVTPIKPADAAELTTEPAAPTQCLNCGWKHGQDPPPVEEADKREFFRALLGNRPFTKTYDLFGGNLKITFRTRTVEDSDLVSQQCQNEVRDGRLPNLGVGMALQTYLFRLKRLHAAASLLRIDPGRPADLPSISSKDAAAMWPPRTTVAPDGEGVRGTYLDNTVAVAHDDLFKGMAEGVFSSILKTHFQFEQLCARLIANIENPDFWKETVGQS